MIVELSGLFGKSHPATSVKESDDLEQRQSHIGQRLAHRPILLTGEYSCRPPSAIVSINQITPDAHTYTLPSFEKRVMLQNVGGGDLGLASSALPTTLASMLEQSFLVSEVLAYIGTLSGEVNRYQNEARVYAVNSSVTAEVLKADFDNTNAAEKSRFELQLTTKEGDTVSIAISQGFAVSKKLSDTAFDSVSVSFDIEGKLSDSEQQALDVFVQNIAAAADSFYSGRGMQLQDLSFIDRNVFSGFSLELKSLAESVSYEYQIDDINHTQSLKGEMGGYQFDISVSLDNPFDIGNIDNNRYLQDYIALIIDAGESYDSEKNDIDFLVDGFISLLKSTANSSGNENDLRQIQRGDNSLDGFFTGLADFKASFKSDVVRPNPQNRSETQFMALSMEQTTEFSSFRSVDGFHEQYRQTFKHESEIRKHKPLVGLDNIDFFRGNYRYDIKKSFNQQTRQLDRIDGLMVGLTLQDVKEDTHTVKTIMDHEVVEFITDKTSSYSQAVLSELNQPLDDTALLMVNLGLILEMNRRQTHYRIDHLQDIKMD